MSKPNYSGFVDDLKKYLNENTFKAYNLNDVCGHYGMPNGTIKFLKLSGFVEMDESAKGLKSKVPLYRLVPKMNLTAEVLHKQFEAYGPVMTPQKDEEKISELAAAGIQMLAEKSGLDSPEAPDDAKPGAFIVYDWTNQSFVAAFPDESSAFAKARAATATFPFHPHVVVKEVAMFSSQTIINVTSYK